MRITVVHAGALGDTLLLAPLLRALRGRFPGCSRTLVTRASFGSLLAALGVAEACADGESTAHSAWFGEPSTAAAVDIAGAAPAWACCDLLLSAVSNGRDAWAAHAAAHAPHAQRLYFQPRPPADFPAHVTAYHRAQLSTLQLPPPPLPQPRQPVAGGPVALHPGSGGPAKNWPVKHFIALGERLGSAGIEPLWVLGEAELETLPPTALAQMQASGRCMCQPPLPLLLEALQGCRALVGNDSGVAHLAAAAGIHTVALFGPSNPVQWAPVGPRVCVLRPHNGGTAMDGIPVDTALAAVAAALEFRPPRAATGPESAA